MGRCFKRWLHWHVAGLSPGEGETASPPTLHHCPQRDHFVSERPFCFVGNGFAVGFCFFTLLWTMERSHSSEKVISWEQREFQRPCFDCDCLQRTYFSLHEKPRVYFLLFQHSVTNTFHIIQKSFQLFQFQLKNAKRIQKSSLSRIEHFWKWKNVYKIWGGKEEILNDLFVSLWYSPRHVKRIFAWQQFLWCRTWSFLLVLFFLYHFGSK